MSKIVSKVTQTRTEITAVTKTVSDGGEVDICLILDLSGSMSGEKAEETEKQVLHFIFDDSNIKRQDKIAIIGFSSELKVLVNYKAKKDYIKEEVKALGIRSLAGLGDGTKLWDTLNQCLKQRVNYVAVKKAKDPTYEPKPFVMLVFTDGGDNESAINAADMRTQLEHPKIANFHLHFIGLAESSGSSEFDKIFRLCWRVSSTPNSIKYVVTSDR